MLVLRMYLQETGLAEQRGKKSVIPKVGRLGDAMQLQGQHVSLISGMQLIPGLN